MVKKYITYIQYGVIKKAVLDENLLSQYKKDKTITSIMEYPGETIMERKFAEAIGVSNGGRRTLLD